MEAVIAEIIRQGTVPHALRLLVYPRKKEMDFAVRLAWYHRLFCWTWVPWPHHLHWKSTLNQQLSSA